MAKEKTETKIEKTEREELWEEFLENYKKENPIKYAQKRATSYTQTDHLGKVSTLPKKDEFAEIPLSFRGLVKVVGGKRFIF